MLVCELFVFKVDPNDPNYDSDSGEPKGPSSNASKRTIKLNTMVSTSNWFEYLPHNEMVRCPK